MSPPSGRFVLRIPPSLHAALRTAAQQQGVSLNEYCRAALEGHVNGRSTIAASGYGSRWLDEARRLLGDGLVGLVLFGSEARGEGRATSDIDLLVVVSGGLPLNRDLYRLWDQKSTDTKANPHFVHLPEDPLRAGSIWYEVALDGILLFERQQEVSTFLQTVRRAVADRLIERRYAHGHPYWVKQDQTAHA